MFEHGFAGILRAGWGKSAGWREKRADQVLITIYQLDHNPAHLFSALLNSNFKESTWVSLFWSKGRLTITTKSILHNFILCWRKVSLMILFTRFLSTAPDSVLLATIIPSLALAFPLLTKNTLQYLSAIISALRTLSKPILRNNRCALEKRLRITTPRVLHGLWRGVHW